MHAVWKGMNVTCAMGQEELLRSAKRTSLRFLRVYTYASRSALHRASNLITLLP